jgi:hypothetical protein
MRFILKSIVGIAMIIGFFNVIVYMANTLPTLALSALTKHDPDHDAIMSALSKSANNRFVPNFTELVTGQTHTPAPPIQQSITTNVPNQNYIEYKGQRTEINAPIKYNTINNSTSSTDKAIKRMDMNSQRNAEETRKKALAIVEKAQRDGQYSNR